MLWPQIMGVNVAGVPADQPKVFSLDGSIQEIEFPVAVKVHVMQTSPSQFMLNLGGMLITLTSKTEIVADFDYGEDEEV